MTIRLLATTLCLLMVLLADGGAVVLRKQTASLSITAFATPSPLHIGEADLSVLVQDARDSSAVLDAEVLLTLSKTGKNDINLHATHAQATNKLLYAANPVVPSPGEWRLNVRVTSHGRSAGVDGVVEVMPEQASVMNYWLYIALVPLGILLYLLNRLLFRMAHASRSVRE